MTKTYEKVELMYPIWQGSREKRCVGIADYRVKGSDIEVHILYTNRHGIRLYPNPFRIGAEEVRKFPIQLVRGLKLYIIPIEAMDEVK